MNLDTPEVLEAFKQLQVAAIDNTREAIETVTAANPDADQETLILLIDDNLVETNAVGTSFSQEERRELIRDILNGKTNEEITAKWDEEESDVSAI